MLDKKTYEKIVGKRIRYEILYRYETVKKLINKYKSGKLSVLDIGSGHGFLPFFLDKSWNINGIDFDPERVRRANQIKHKNAFFTTGDAENFNLHKKFDVVLALDVIEHLDHPEMCIKNVSKHLNKDGIFIVSNPNRRSFWTLLFDNRFIRLENHKHYWTPKQFASMAARYGFKMIEVLPRPFFGEAAGWMIKDYRPFLKYDNYLGKKFPNNCTGCFLVFKFK
jgi:2-polyprenyl-3-methyl-5-hydroxy-6-metoxy-1,4-benzoquinol methylase